MKRINPDNKESAHVELTRENVSNLIEICNDFPYKTHWPRTVIIPPF